MQFKDIKVRHFQLPLSNHSLTQSKAKQKRKAPYQKGHSRKESLRRIHLKKDLHLSMQSSMPSSSDRQQQPLASPFADCDSSENEEKLSLGLLESRRLASPGPLGSPTALGSPVSKTSQRSMHGYFRQTSPGAKSLSPEVKN
jgi:hypothetical protein